MGDVVKETMDRLKKENLKPISRWLFVVRKLLMWSLVFFASIFSAIALEAVLFLIFQFDWSSRLGPINSLLFAFRLLPYFWIILAIIFIFGAYEAVRHTNSGYKYNWIKVSFIVFGAVLGLCILVFTADLGRKADLVARKNVPVYHQMVPAIKDQWLRPDEGFLAGEIIANFGKQVVLEDLEGREWNVVINENTIIFPMVDITADEGVKIVGEEMEGGNFKAVEIRPWKGNMMQRDFNHEEFKGGYYGPKRNKAESDLKEGKDRDSKKDNLSDDEEGSDKERGDKEDDEEENE